MCYYVAARGEVLGRGSVYRVLCGVATPGMIRVTDKNKCVSGIQFCGDCLLFLGAAVWAPIGVRLVSRAWRHLPLSSSREPQHSRSSWACRNSLYGSRFRSPEC